MMSRSETGMINTAANPSQPSIQTMNMAYGPAVDGTSVYKPGGPTPPYQGGPTGNGDGISSGDGLLKKKRGRPRKYGPDGSMAIPVSVAPPQPAVNASQPSAGFTVTNQALPHQQQQQQTPPPLKQEAPPHPPLQPHQQQEHSGHQVNVTQMPTPGHDMGSQQQPKKARGRPPGAGNKKHQLEALGSAGIGFTPHVIIVKAGEDLSSRIMSFSQNGPRAICILSANGSLSNVTLRQSATSGGSVTYEGRFEILSLSGSFMNSDKDGHHGRSGGLSISLAGPDGRVIGGGVAGVLIAASPVQVVAASFFTDDGREVKIENQMEPMSTPLPKQQQQHQSGGMGPTGAGGSSPTSRGTVSESSGGGGGGSPPMNHSNPNMHGHGHGLHWM